MAQQPFRVDPLPRGFQLINEPDPLPPGFVLIDEEEEERKRQQEQEGGFLDSVGDGLSAAGNAIGNAVRSVTSSDSVARSALNLDGEQTQPKPAQQQEASPKYQGFGSAFLAGIDDLQKLTYSAGEAIGEVTGNETLEGIGERGRIRNTAEAAEQGERGRFQDIESLADAIGWAGQTSGNLIPVIVPGLLGGAAAGAAAGVAGVSATVGAAVGAFVPSLALGVGEVQATAKDKAPDEDANAWTFIGGSAIGALDSVLPGKVGSKLVSAFGREAAEEAAIRTLSRPMNALSEGGKGMGIEALTESLQTAIGEVTASLASKQDINWDALPDQMIEAAAAGGLMGGGIGAATGAATGGKKPVIEPEPGKIYGMGDAIAELNIEPWEAAERYGTPVEKRLNPRPTTRQEQAIEIGTAKLTQADIDGPYDNNLLAEGYGTVELDVELSAEDAILKKYGVPKSGSEVVIRRGPDAIPETGKVLGAFTVADEQGEAQGIRVQMNDGSTYEELFSDIERGGQSIQSTADYLAPPVEPMQDNQIATDVPVSNAVGTPVTATASTALPRDVLKSKIRTVESGGKDTAKNPLSSASGRYQFIDSTWAALGGDPNKRFDPAEQERLMDKLVSQNEAALGKAGIEATAGNLYLAHFLGAGGAKQALADPNAPVSTAVQKANPFAKGWTNGQLAAWADKKMGGAGVVSGPDGAGSDLTFTDWLAKFSDDDGTKLDFTDAAAAEFKAPAAEPEGESYSEKVTRFELAPIKAAAAAEKVHIDATEFNGEIRLDAVERLEGSEPGAGARAIKGVLSQADALGLPVRLRAQALGDNRPQAGLMDYYRGLGFREIGPDTSEMVRAPGSTQAATEALAPTILKDGFKTEKSAALYVKAQKLDTGRFQVEQRGDTYAVVEAAPVEAPSATAEAAPLSLATPVEIDAPTAPSAAAAPTIKAARAEADARITAGTLDAIDAEAFMAGGAGLGSRDQYSFSGKGTYDDGVAWATAATPVPPTPAKPLKFDPISHVPAMREPIAKRSSLEPQALAKALGLTNTQAQRVMGAVASAPDSGVFLSRKGKLRRVAKRQKPLHAMEFIRSIGGVSSGTHNLRNHGALARFPGVINNRKGQPVDEIGFALWERGYIRTPERPTEAETLEYLDDASITRRYATDDLTDIAERDAAEDNERYEEQARGQIIDLAYELEIELADAQIDEALGYVAAGESIEFAVVEIARNEAALTLEQAAELSGWEPYDTVAGALYGDGSRQDSDQDAAESGARPEAPEGVARESGEGSQEPASDRPADRAVAPTDDPLGPQEGELRAGLQAKAEERLRGKTAQKEPGEDGGLFDTQDTTGDMFADPRARSGGINLVRTPAEAKQFAAEMGKLLKRLGISDRITAQLVTGADLAHKNTQGEYWNRVISVALDAARDPTRVLQHEAVHAMKALGLFLPTEWKLLTDMAWRDADIKAWALANYSKLSLADQREEAAAEWIARNYAQRRDATAAKGLGDRIAARIAQFLNAVAAAYRKATGRQDGRDVARAIDRGAIGARPTGFGEAARDRPDATSFGRKGLMPAENGRRIQQELAKASVATPSLRKHGLSKEAGNPLAPFTGSEAVETQLKTHPDYRAAKAGDEKAALRLVRDLVPREMLEQARDKWRGATFVPVMAEEATGDNRIPHALARLLASAADGNVETAIAQTNRAFHTGAKAMDRIIARPLFASPVKSGERYVIVDDVTVMGATLVEAANHIQENGGKAIGTALLVNAARNPLLGSDKLRSRAVEGRFGDVVRSDLGIEPEALTPAEAQYLLGFRDADALRARVAKAAVEREGRLASRRIAEEPSAVDEPRASAAGPITPATPEFSDASIEERWKNASKGIGLSGPKVAERMTEGWRDIAAGFSRHWRNLPNEPRFADLQQQLRKLEAAPEAALDETVRHLKQLVGKLSKEEYDLFSRKTVLDDLMWEADRSHALPFGLTPETLREALSNVDSIITTMPSVSEAVRKRKLHNRRLADDMVKAGVLTPEQVRNPAYFRHMVLDYARAEAKLAKGGKIKSPYWAKRLGSSLDINANLLEAEFEWVSKARRDIETARVLAWIKGSEHNVREELRAKAKAGNKATVDEVIAEDPDAAKMDAKFRSNIGRGLQIVKDELEAATLIPPPYLQNAADALTSGSSDGSIFPFLSWIMDEGKPGAMGAAMVLSATGRRKAWEKGLLRQKWVDPEDMDGLVAHYKPEGFATWQPRPGKHMFTAQTVSEHVIDLFVGKLAETKYTGIDQAELTSALSAIKPQLVAGGDRYTMILPEELVATLDDYGDRRADGMVAQIFSGVQGAWKQWVLINPRRFIKYNLNNQSGDMDAIIAGNPRALLKVGAAWKELWSVWVQNKQPSALYKEAADRGVFTSGLSAQEIPDIQRFSGLRHLTESKNLRPDKITIRAVGNLWNGLQGFTNYREALFRLAAFIEYRERIAAGKPTGYGASVPSIVDAVADPADKAALLARDLIGDYGAISVAGGWLRRFLIPFWSWTEINTKRYWRLTGNVYHAFRHGDAKGGAAAAGRLTVSGALTASMLLMRMGVVFAAINLWNNLLFDDEEEELSDDQRSQLHLILGRNANGEIITIRLQGALSDVFNMFGFGDAVAGMRKYQNGQGTIGQAVWEMVKSPINRVGTAVTPIFSTPIEQALDLELWPDMFEPRKIHDNARHLFQTLNIEHEYDLVADRPSRGYDRSWVESLVYKRDPGEMSYNEAKGITFEWMESVKGESGGAGRDSPRSNALRDYKLALRFGDVDAANDALDRYESFEGNLRGLNQSIKAAHPIASIPKKFRQEFFDSLTEEQVETFYDAETWYDEVYLGRE